jgi:5-methyltetrahydrofolate--homocysteine methyltransferase
MVPADVIVKTALEEKPDLVCLSGLITPSLEEMVHVTEELQRAGLTIPVMIGGATTSKLHTAVKIAPHYSYTVVHVLDASQAPLVAAKLLNPLTRPPFIDELNREYEKLRLSLQGKREELVSLSYARRNPIKRDWKAFQAVKPAQEGVRVIPFIPIEEIQPYINWKFFFAAWELGGRYAEITGIHGCDSCRASWLAAFPEEERPKASEAMQLYKDAARLLNRLIEMKAEYCRAVYGFFPANSQGDDIVLANGPSFPMLRQQAKKEEDVYKSLADYILPASEGRTDYIGFFAVTAGAGADYLKQKLESEGDTYTSMLLQSLTDRLAEATAEYLHEKVRREYWGYAPDESLSFPDLLRVKYRGIRPAVGYPSIPDQLMNFEVDKLLNFSKIGISLTENGAMYPTASVSGLYLAHPDSSYFMIGAIDKEQLNDYARRRGISEAAARAVLSKNIE